MKSKYHFHLLAIGESMLVPGILRNVRTSASMWGTRYGIWLSVEPEASGIRVTRHADPINTQRKSNLTISEQLQRHDDALRFISLLLIQIKTKLDEH